MDLKEKLKNLPDSCGVYIMKDKGGKVIYIGKAVSLKKRVQSYFAPRGDVSPKIYALVSTISNIEYIITNTEKEALLIEYSLIKKFRPKYNIEYKDDKRYPFIKLTANEDFPRLVITRSMAQDGAKYYGPYPDGTSLRGTLRWIRKIFPLRTCKNSRFNKRQVCLDYHIKRCLGPCIGKIKVKDYKNLIKEVDLFLKGQHKKLLCLLEAKMNKAAQNLNFEEATRLRNEIFGLKRLTEKINFRQINKVEIFKQVYKLEEPVAKLSDLKKKLSLKTDLKRIEAFDVSNISGQEAVGSLVVFINGEPSNSQYRRFRIKTVNQIDDCGMIKEIVKRRYTRLIRENQKLPNLILVDGGKTQVNTASQTLKDLGLTSIPVIGLAKKFEYIFIPYKRLPIVLDKDSPALHLVEQIRDEAHRFALRYHRYLRRKIK